MEITSDSRWSIQLDRDEILFVDNAPFEKMVERDSFALVMAGDSQLIYEWKQWAKTGITQPRPNVTRIDEYYVQRHISICFIIKPVLVLFDNEVSTFVTPKARFSGSGARHAKSCWEKRNCAKQAIISAKEKDYFTGGSVKYVDLTSPDNNLSVDDMTVMQLHDLITKEGTVMNTVTKKSIPVKKYKNQEQIIADTQANKLVASAPTGSAESPWSDQQEKALDMSIDFLRKFANNKTN